MRLVLWGDWIPDLVESLAMEVRNTRSSRVSITLQVDPSYQTAAFCNVPLDEMVRAVATDRDALFRIVQNKASSVVLINGWSLIHAQKVDRLLLEMESLARSAEALVCWMPRPWSVQQLPHLFVSKPDQNLNSLSENSRLLFEAFWNGALNAGVVLSAPCKEMLETACGRPALGPVMRFGSKLWPVEMQKSAARFCERQQIVKALLNATDQNRRLQTWFVDVPSTESWECSHSKGFAMVRDAVVPECSWESYCVDTGMHRIARWLFGLGVAEYLAPQSAQKRNTANRTFFPAQ